MEQPLDSINPGVDGIPFTIELSNDWYPNGIKLEVGKDIELGIPEMTENGIKYEFKAISEKAIKFFNNK